MNPQLAVTVNAQAPILTGHTNYDPMRSDEYWDFLFLGGTQFPTTSVNLGTGTLANIQGNVTVHNVELTVDDGQGSLPGIQTLTDSTLTGWATLVGTHPVLRFDTSPHDSYPTLAFATSLNDRFLVIGSAVNQFDVENTPAARSNANRKPGHERHTRFGLCHGQVSATAERDGELQPCDWPALVADGSVNKVGKVNNVFYMVSTTGGMTPERFYSQPITFDHTGAGRGQLVYDVSNGGNLGNGPDAIFNKKAATCRLL